MLFRKRSMLFRERGTLRFSRQSDITAVGVPSSPLGRGITYRRGNSSRREGIWRTGPAGSDWSRHLFPSDAARLPYMENRSSRKWLELIEPEVIAAVVF